MANSFILNYTNIVQSNCADSISTIGFPYLIHLLFNSLAVQTLAHPPNTTARPSADKPYNPKLTHLSHPPIIACQLGDFPFLEKAPFLRDYERQIKSLHTERMKAFLLPHHPINKRLHKIQNTFQNPIS